MSTLYALVMGLVITAFAVWALIQFIFFFDIYGSRIKHPMLNPNDLAGLFCLAIFPVLALFFMARRKAYSAAALALFTVIYLALLTTQSRGAFLSFCLAMLVFLPFAARHPALTGKAGIAWAKLATLLPALTILPLIVNALGSGRLTQGNLAKMEALIGGQVNSVTDRLLLWDSTWQMIRDYFWTGTGLGTFYFYYTAYRHRDDRSDGYFAHMDPLQFWSDMGIGAFILFYAVLLAILGRTIKALRSARKGGPPQPARLLMMAAFCSMLALTLNTHISFHLYMPAIMIPLAVLLAFWYVQSEDILGAQDRRHITLTHRRNTALVTLLAFIMIICTGWAARWGGALHYAARAHSAAQTPNPDFARALAYADMTALIGPPSLITGYETRARLRLNHTIANRDNMDRAALLDQAQQIESDLDQAQKRNPPFTAIWSLRAQLYYTFDNILYENGRDKAIALLEQIMVQNPLALQNRLALAALYRQSGQFNKAHELLEDGLSWPRPRGLADIQLLSAAAQMRRLKGDQQGAEALARAATQRAQRYGLTPPQRNQ